MGNISLNTNANVAASDQHNLNLLQPLANELLGIASRLFDVASSGGEAAVRLDCPSQRLARPAGSNITRARQAYAMRRKRAIIFGNPDLFGEPAWDILLDLYIAQADGKPVSVSSACIGSAAPATTGLRWLAVLAEEGLIVRENDPGDHRRVLVRLTDKGSSAMDQYFDAVETGA